MEDYSLMGMMPVAMTSIAQNLLASDELIKKSGIAISELTPRLIAKLLRSFSHLKDSRQKHKVKYPIQALFVIVILAKLSHLGHNCCEIAGFAKSYKALLGESGVLKGDRTPSHDTIQRFLESLDIKWIRSLLVKIKEFY